MASSSKDLLQLEHNKPFTSPLESTLLVCKKDSKEKKKAQSDSKPIGGPLPKSQVLGKVRDFLGVISEANERLNLDAKDNSEKYDIEALTGDESQVIEMDLMLGVADLQTPEAVAAAESAITGYQRVITLPVSSSEDESDDSSDDDEDSDDDEQNESEDGGIKTSFLVKCSETMPGKDKSSSKDGGNRQSQKRQRIVELP